MIIFISFTNVKEIKYLDNFNNFDRYWMNSTIERDN